jgi:hypothetical protein
MIRAATRILVLADALRAEFGQKVREKRDVIKPALAADKNILYCVGSNVSARGA